MIGIISVLLTGITNILLRMVGIASILLIGGLILNFLVIIVKDLIKDFNESDNIRK